MENTNIKVYLSIFGDNFDLNTLSKKLNILPTKTYKKGDKSTHFLKAPIKKETCWEYSTEKIETPYFNDISPLILNKFNNKIAIINKFTNENNLEVKVTIVGISEKGIVPSLFFDSNFIQFLYELGAQLDIDLYNN